LVLVTQKFVQPQEELDRVQVEASKYQKGSQEAEACKARVLQELESTSSAADELRLALEKAEVEEARARQETELVELRLGEVQRGASESAVAKAELDVVRDGHAAAKAELQSVRAELASLEKERADADAVVARAREAAKAVEDLAAELVALKKELESSSAAHYEAEEKRMALAAALEQDKSQWQSELEEAELEAKKLREELMAACDLEVETEAAAQLLKDQEEEEKLRNKQMSQMLEKTKKELEEVNDTIVKAKYEAECLSFAAATIRDNMAREKAELAALQRKEELSSASIASLEEELSSELAGVKEFHDESKMAEQVAEARLEAEEAKEKALSAREESAKAREEASVAMAAVKTVEARLEAVTREILAANAAEEIATATANALLQESSKPSSEKEQGVTLSMEEYEELSRRAREMEDDAGKRVVEAVKLIKEAKDAEVRSLEKLKQLARQTEQRQQAMLAATDEADEAEFAKMSAERELRQWLAEHDLQQPRAGLAEISVLEYRGGDGRGNPHILSPRGGYYTPRNEAILAAAATEATQKKTFFPRMIMFLARKRAQTAQSWK
jgi:hypothetical protein